MLLFGHLPLQREEGSLGDRLVQHRDTWDGIYTLTEGRPGLEEYPVFQSECSCPLFLGETQSGVLYKDAADLRIYAELSPLLRCGRRT